MAGRSAAGRHRAPLPRARRGRGPVPGPRGVGRPRRLRCLGARRALRARRLRRRTARRVQPERPGLGPAAAAARPAGRRALQVLHRHAARVHAPRGGLAHRPRDGADAPVLGARRPRRARRGLRALSAARADGHRHAGERAQPLHGDRRGPRHRGRRDARCTGAQRAALVPAALFRARRRWRVQAPAGLSARGAGGGEHARPADTGRLVGRSRPAGARAPRAVREPGSARAAAGRARAGPRAPAACAAACRPAGRGRTSRGRGAADAGTGRGRARLRGHGARARDGDAAGGRARRARPAQPARHGGRASQLAAQAAAGAAGAGRRRARAGAEHSPRAPAPACAAAHAGAAACRGDGAACDLPPAVPRRLRLRRCAAGAALPAASGREPCVLLAAHARTGGQPARLRRRRARRDQPRAGRPRRLRALPRRGARAGPRAAAGPGTQPHGHRQRQRLVDGRAGERPGLAVRALLRHRLAAGGSRARGQGAAARAG